MPPRPAIIPCRRSALALIASLSATLCATLGAEALAAPSAGTLLQEVEPVKPPQATPGKPGVLLEAAPTRALPASAPIAVTHLRIRGNTLFADDTLHALVADAEGRSLTLAELGELAARLAGYYHRQGYPLTRVVVPAQRIADGEVTLEVIEARYGRVTLDNTSRVDGALLAATLAPLRDGEPIEQHALERQLLLLNDIPGLRNDTLLKPGETPGSADLRVASSDERTFTGSLSADSYGSEYTGRPRAGANLALYNPLRHGDVLSATALTSGADLNYGRLAYETLLNGDGTRVGGAVSALDYRLGHGLDALDAHGSAREAGLWLRQPLIRRQDVNFAGQLQYRHVALSDRIDAAALKTDRRVDDLVVGVQGDWRDGLGMGASTAWNLLWTAGRVAFDDADARLYDAASARTAGHFDKLNAAITRLQALPGDNAIFVRASAQWAADNLDASEKLVVGGPYSVRAYDVGAISGDAGYLLSAELRHNFAASWGGQFQLIGFVDSAQVKVNQTPWASGSNRATLSGAGVGVNWLLAPWQARAYVAAPIGNRPALIADNSKARAALEVSWQF